jgi:putative acetyltransferase
MNLLIRSKSNRDFTIRRGQLNDLTELQKIFIDTVKSICITDYNEKQIEAWLSGVKNEKRWRDIILNQIVLVALDQDKIIGFSSLDNLSYIDLLYIHKDYQRLGIAHQLYSLIEKEAKSLGQNKLVSDVSITARGFFEGVGFKVVNEQKVIRQGVELVNFRMTKDLVNQ